MRTNKIALFILLLVCCTAPALRAQLSLSGQTGVHFYKSARTESPRVVADGNPAFGWQSHLFLDASVTDNVSAMANVRVADDGVINIDDVVIRLTNVTPLELNIQAGKFDLPFGNLAERRFPRRNPLFSLPLVYTYRTALPDHATSVAEIVSNQGQGRGMRLLDGGMYDVGAMVYGSLDVFDYALSVSNETISTTSYGTGSSKNDLGLIARLAVTPTTGLTIGAAYSWGSYLDQYASAANHAVDANAYKQRAWELDVTFSRGHGAIYGEAVYSVYPVSLETGDENFGVLGYSLEGKYTLMPRLYAALRASGLEFSNVLLGTLEQPWDYAVTEWEGGVGFFIDRDVLLKLVRRETRIHGGTMPKDNLTVLQLVVAY